jgi:hypothetical protein
MSKYPEGAAMTFEVSWYFNIAYSTEKILKIVKGARLHWE